MKGAMGNMMKQAQKMQEDMQKAQQEIANMEVEGLAGGGMVKVLMNGRHELRRVNIDESLMQDDKEMIEDLLAAAVNDAADILPSDCCRWIFLSVSSGCPAKPKPACSLHSSVVPAKRPDCRTVGKRCFQAQNRLCEAHPGWSRQTVGAANGTSYDVSGVK